MKLTKKLLKNNILTNILSRVLYLYVRLVQHTTRWKIINEDLIPGYTEHHAPGIYVFWHGRLLMMPCFFAKNAPMHVVVSSHRDGEFIARVMRLFGCCLIRGSSRKGGAAALRGVLTALRHQSNIGITPDGPRGPRMRINSNIVAIAKMTGCPIIPVTNALRRRKIFNSWDRFMLPSPFNSGVVIFGNPVYVPATSTKEDIEKITASLEKTMISITQEADRLLHVPTVEPAPQETKETL